MGSRFCLFFFLASLPAILAQEFRSATIIVNGTRVVAETDDNFVCATLDWWPRGKCNYQHCPWGNTSVLNLDLSNPLLAKAIQAFKRLRIRVGGSLQDQLLYNVGSLKFPCHPFRKMKGGLFGFSTGCLNMTRWDELYHFLNKTGAIVTFGLNALYGRHKIKNNVWGEDWDSSNAYDFINYTVSKRYQIDSWELGNELCGNGIEASISAELYGKDVIKLKDIINNLYKNSPSKPLLVAPGGFYDREWFAKFLQVSGSGVVNGITHHIYNLGAGKDPELIKRMLDPHHLDKISETFSDLSQTIQKNDPSASAWIGESGGAYNSGGLNVSNTFVNSFWYLDQLGMSSNYHTKVYCRQTLIGGNYGLISKTTYLPNPDYYSALLWHRLMGKRVLAIDSDASPYLRSYAHCTKERAGITLLLINLSSQTDFIFSIQNNTSISLEEIKNTNENVSFVDGLKNSVSRDGNGSLFREEYHLTPKGGNLQSRTMNLNGIPLQIRHGRIPKLNPVRLDVKSLLYIARLSMSFIVFPNFDAPACV